METGGKKMNKRQKKKLDKKLRLAIRKLNDDVAISENLKLASDEDIERAFARVKKTHNSIKQTLREYKKLENVL